MRNILCFSDLCCSMRGGDIVMADDAHADWWCAVCLMMMMVDGQPVLWTPIILCWLKVCRERLLSTPSPPGAAAPANVGSVSGFYSRSSRLSVQALYTPLHPIKISFLDGWRKLFILVLFCLSSQTKPFHFMAQTEPWFYLFCVSRCPFHWCTGQNEKKKRFSVVAVPPSWLFSHSSEDITFLLNSFTASKN